MSPTPSPPYRPTSDLVAVAWLAAYVPELQGGAIVGTALPNDITKWLDAGFLQVTTIPGGRTPDVDLPRRLPVVQLDAWATASTAGASSNKPPWNLASQLIEHVRIATEDAQTGRYGKRLAVKADYLDVRVQAVYLLSEPAKVTDDPSGFARFTADLAVDWVPA